LAVPVAFPADGEGAAPAEAFACEPAVYYWFLDHPDRAVTAWRRLGAKCLTITDRGGGRFGWADENGSDIVWETVYRTPELRIWYAEGKARPGPLMPLVPVRAVVLLTTVPGGAPTADRADPAWAARRLAHSAAYERRPYFGLVERARYAFPDRERADLPGAARGREETVLGAVLDRTTVVEARTPFPVDPRRVLDAVERAL
jgi:hypothetical protein